jgi:hypothetical protein
VKLGAFGLRTGALAWFSGEFLSFAFPEVIRFNRLRGGRCGVRIPIGTNVFLSPKRPERPWGDPATCSMSTGFFRMGKVAGT